MIAKLFRNSELKRRREQFRKFEQRLFSSWENPLNILETVLMIVEESGEEFCSNLEDDFLNDNELLVSVLVHFHARACQLGKEILKLLKGGFAEGAFARWRTLHEIVVISFFIKDHGNEMAHFNVHSSNELPRGRAPG